MAGLGAGIALAGCGASGSDPGAAPGASEQRPTSSAPAPSRSDGGSGEHGPDSAAERYLRIAQPPNCALQSFQAAREGIPAGATVGDAMRVIKPEAAAVAEAYDVFLAELAAQDWPAGARAALEAMADETRTEQVLWEQLAVAEADRFQAAFAELADFWEQSSKVDAARAALGLEPAGPAVAGDCAASA